MISIAFYQPDIAGNFGAGLRLAACLGMDITVIEPCGFPLDDRRMKRAAMDYGRLPKLTRYASFSRFYDANRQQSLRTVLLSRHASTYHDEFKFQGGDVLLVGQESSGVPAAVAETVDAQIKVPMRPQIRSLNVVTALAIVVGEALRQTGGFDDLRLTDT